MRAKEKHKHTKNDKEKGTGITKYTGPTGITGLWQPSVHSDVALNSSMSALPIIVSQKSANSSMSALSIIVSQKSANSSMSALPLIVSQKSTNFQYEDKL